MALAAVAAAAILYTVAAGPLARRVREGEARVARLERDAAWMREAARKLKNAPARERGSIMAFADKTLRRAGIAAAAERIAAEGQNGVRVWFGEVEFGRLAEWLAAVSRAGVRVAGCRLDRTGPGKVKGEVRLER